MEIREMKIEDIESRVSAIKEEMNSPEADLDALTTEVVQLEERKKEIIAQAEQRKAELDAITVGEIPTEIVKTFTEERKKMDLKEIRSSQEYAQAYLNVLKNGDDTECRALLSTNVSGGVVPVPTFLETEIKNAWEDCKIATLVKQTNYKGNVKVGFEVSATGASVHVEGTNAPDEETLVWGSTELKAESVKKWITISDEAIEGTTIDTLGEIYKELAQKIIEKVEELIIAKIEAAPSTTTTSAVGVPVLSASAIAADTIINAEALLSGKANNLYIAMNRQTYAAFVSVALAANYAIDVFDGLKDRIVFTDALPSFSAASSNETYAIVGDFGYGFQINKPNGNDITIKVDDTSLAEKDLVKVVGRQYIGMGVVAPKSFVKIQK